MRVVIMENTDSNLAALKNEIHALLPNALVKGFTNGKDAQKWCEEHASDVDLFFGNWWNEGDSFNGPEGATIADHVKWEKRPHIILFGNDEMFRPWSAQCGADAFLLRPISMECLRDVLEEIEI